MSRKAPNPLPPEGVKKPKPPPSPPKPKHKGWEDNRYVEGKCMMCLENKEVRHINLYIIGSEGFDCCYECERELLKFIRNKRHEAGKRRKEKFRNRMPQL